MLRIISNIISGQIKAIAIGVIEETGIASAPIAMMAAIGIKQHAAMRSMCFLDMVSIHLPRKYAFGHAGNTAQGQRH